MSVGTTPRHTLPRERRLRTGRDFQRPKAGGQRVTRGSLALNWLDRSDSQVIRLGVVTSRKLGQATVRARARRLMREAFRLHQHEIARPADLVLVARQSIVGRKLAAVEADFVAVLKQAKLLVC